MKSKVSILGLIFLNSIPLLRAEIKELCDKLNGQHKGMVQCAKVCTGFSMGTFTAGHMMTLATDDYRWKAFGALAGLGAFAICGGYMIKKWAELPPVKNYCEFDEQEHGILRGNVKLSRFNSFKNILFHGYFPSIYQGAQEGFLTTTYVIGVPLIVYAGATTIKDWLKK